MFKKLKELVRGKSAGFQPENGLETAMLKAFQGQGDMPAFYRALYYAHVFIPQTGQAGAAGDTLQLPVIEQNGRRYVPVFSSMTQLRAFAPRGTSYVSLTCADLVAGWNDQCWMLLNPGGQLGRELSPAEVRALPEEAGQSPLAYPAGTKVMVGDPAKEPVQLLKAMGKFCEATPAVLRAYRAQTMYVLPGETPHITIGFELAGGTEIGPVLAGARETVAAATGERVDVVFIDREKLDPVTGFMVEQQPFYRKKG